MTVTLGPNALSEPEIQARFDELLDEVQSASRLQVGYPTNQTYEYGGLSAFLDYSINNVGDPFHQSNYRSNTHAFEREVIARFAGLMRISPDDAWGYVTSGGTEGNMYGLYLARELFPNAMFYFSEETHYSVLKNVRVLNARYIMIKRQDDGEIDYDDLFEMIKVNRDVPAVIMANVGTTMRGAVDNIPRLREILAELAVTNSYIHADAALSGMILPFVDDPQPFGFDAGIDSVSVSGHKMIGAPLPCGVVLTKKPHVERVGRAIEYVGVQDTTLSGVPERIHTAVALAGVRAIWGRRIPRPRGQRAGHGGIRRGTVQRAGHPGLAAQKLRYGGVPASGAGGIPEMADGSGGRHYAHHHDAPRYQRDDRRTGGRLRRVRR